MNRAKHLQKKGESFLEAARSSKRCCMLFQTPRFMSTPYIGQQACRLDAFKDLPTLPVRILLLDVNLVKCKIRPEWQNAGFEVQTAEFLPLWRNGFPSLADYLPWHLQCAPQTSSVKDDFYSPSSSTVRAVRHLVHRDTGTEANNWVFKYYSNSWGWILVFVFVFGWFVPTK